MKSATLVAGGRQAQSVAAALAARDDDRLCTLLRRRPDLGAPPPRTVAALAERAVQEGSAFAAYESLDRSAQQVAEVLHLFPPPVAVGDLARLLAPGVTAAHLERALGELEELALAFRAGDRITPNPGLVGVANRTGLGPPIATLLSTRRATELADICRRLGLKAGRDKATSLQSITVHLAQPANVADLLAKAPAAAADLADRAAREWGFVEGSPYHLEDRTPAGWLANRGLLASVDWYRLVMPGEVGLAMRGGHVYEEFRPDGPELRTHSVDAEAVDAAGAEAALAVVADLAACSSAGSPSHRRCSKTAGWGCATCAGWPRPSGATSATWPGCSTSPPPPAWPGSTGGAAWPCPPRPSTSGWGWPPPPGGPGWWRAGWAPTWTPAWPAPSTPRTSASRRC